MGIKSIRVLHGPGIKATQVLMLLLVGLHLDYCSAGRADDSYRIRAEAEDGAALINDLQRSERGVAEQTKRYERGVADQLVVVHRNERGVAKTQEDAQDFLRNFTAEASLVYAAEVKAAWNYESNLTDANSERNVQQQLLSAQFSKRSAGIVRSFDDVVATFPDDVQRQMKLISDNGVAALDDELVEEFNQVLAEMGKTYSSAKVCRRDNASDCLLLDPGLEEVMASSIDYDELVWAWKGFRDAVGVPNKPLYGRYVEIVNQGARANGYEDHGDYWRSEYGEDLPEKARELYDAILPLYRQLHAYVRRRLSQVYGDKIDVNGGLLPANVLGDMWGRFWGNIYHLVVPYPARPNIDVTDAMVNKSYNATWIFETADDFFTSMGLLPVNDAFWENSRLTRPEDGRDVVCHPSAWDVFTGDDFRIAMCTKIRMEDFLVAHHEMGHVQYFMQYKDQPIPFRDGANGAFHEAIGEVMSLSVGTPRHLREVGLLEEFDEDDHETDINFLLKTSLDTIATLPFSLGLSEWRWDLFAGEFDIDKSMSQWWQIKRDLVGVAPPVERTEDDFDPGAMFHFVINYPFVGYYIRTIIQFQFYKALCEAANHTGPLHTCDFYRSQEAGDKLANMLSMGKSQPWPEAMEAITGQREMKADAILEYYAPLMEWLERTNAENGEVIGWKSGCSMNGPGKVPLLLAIILTIFSTKGYASS